MSKYNNSAKIFTGSTGGELRISLKDTRQTINATNNRAQYYAELAEKYKNEAKEHRDNAQYYAEQNSDVTFEYIDSVKESLEGQIATKQDNGDYALKSELPTKVSELDNDLEYTSFDAVIPSQIGNESKVLCTDGEKLFWNTNSSYKLFDTKILDYVLNYEELQGWALQGTYVYKEALAGTRYGYPDFYAKCLEEYQEATGTETVNGVTIKVNSNGHKFYNIVDKSAIDSFFNTMGIAWFYGIDTENERIFLPRDNTGVEAQLQLYICVGNTTSYECVTEVVNQNMGILEQVNQGIESRVKLDGSNAEFPYVIETYVNGSSWYRVYSDGWCEQGGLYTPASDTLNAPVALLKAYPNSNYNISTTNFYLDGNYPSSESYAKLDTLAVRSAFLTKKTNGSFSLAKAAANYSVNWRTCGYLA